MKRTDLKPGTDYLLNRSNDWDAWGYAPRSSRVRVLTVQALVSTQPGYGYGRTSDKTVLITAHDGAVYPVAGVREKRQYDTLTDVLVMHLNDDGTPVVQRDGTPSIRLVPLRQIRATWAEGSAKLAQIAKAKQEAEIITLNREAANRARVQAVVRALSDRGIAHAVPDYEAKAGKVRLSLAQIEALLGITV